ncbi:MAG: hemerythrin domain-containing protein [Ignavibacteria bacterium]|nr:hemerythrin domain-containing protein [Ignavibacteria bacterium]
MKRHSALINLSREHHAALILAQILKKDGPNFKDLPTDDEGKRNYTISIYKTDLAKHFQFEEEILFPFVNKQSDLLKEQTAQLIGEHKKLKSLIKKLLTPGNVETTLDRIGMLLEKHIRFEERVYFQKVQEIFPDNELDELSNLFLHAHLS